MLQKAAAKDRSWPSSKEMLSIDRVSWLAKELSRHSGTGNAAWIIESGIPLAVDYASVSFLVALNLERRPACNAIPLRIQGNRQSTYLPPSWPYAASFSFLPNGAPPPLCPSDFCDAWFSLKYSVSTPLGFSCRDRVSSASPTQSHQQGVRSMIIETRHVERS